MTYQNGRLCEACGIPLDGFVDKDSRAKYCSVECKAEARKWRSGERDESYDSLLAFAQDAVARDKGLLRRAPKDVPIGAILLGGREGIVSQGEMDAFGLHAIEDLQG